MKIPMLALAPAQMFSNQGAKGDDVQAVKADVAVFAHADMPGEHAVAVSCSGRLREIAGAGDRTLASVEPIAADTPL
jgi:hypothetical protein